jgi:molybdopterin converting factor small subunit
MGGKLKITVKYLGAFADVTRSKEETLEIASPLVGSLIDLMVERNGEKFHELLIDPATGALRGGATLLVNGHLRGEGAELSDGDEVALLTAVAGG